MSTSVYLGHQIGAMLLAAPQPAPPGAGGASGGVIDWLTNKTAALSGLFRSFSVVAGMGFVIWQALASRGAFARIIISGIAAGVFIWIVWNVTSLQDRVGEEVNAAGVVHAQPAPQGQPDVAVGLRLSAYAGGGRR